MDNIREKLGDMVFQEVYAGGIVCDAETYEHVREGFLKIADKLITNGVTVLPCQVGDVVWYNKAELQETCPAKVIGIHINYYTPSTPLWVTIEYQSKLVGRQEEKMASYVFKLLCHYDREEAEAHLPQPPKGE